MTRAIAFALEGRERDRERARERKKERKSEGDIDLDLPNDIRETEQISKTYKKLLEKT